MCASNDDTSFKIFLCLDIWLGFRLGFDGSKCGVCSCFKDRRKIKIFSLHSKLLWLQIETFRRRRNDYWYLWED